MIAFLCLFLPPVALVYLWDKAVQPLQMRLRWAVAYALATLGVNTFALTAVRLFAGAYNDVLPSMDRYPTFAIKYILAATIAAVAIPLGYRLIRDHLSIRMDRPKNIRIPWRLLACFFAAILFALNFIRIFDNNFWGDEAYSILLARKSVWGIISQTADSEHPPLYYLMVKLFCMVLGYRSWVYHLVSVVPLALILVFALTKGWKHFGGGASMVLMTAASLATQALYYHQEVRMYSWAELFVLLSFFELYQILRKGEKTSYFWFALWSLGAAYTHYYALASVAFFYVIIIIRGWVCVPRERKRVLVTCVGTVLAYLPWFVVLLRTFARDSQNFWITNIPTLQESVDYLVSGALGSTGYRLLLVAFLFAVAYESGLLTIRWTEEKKLSIRISFTNLRFTARLIWIAGGLLCVFGMIGIGIGISHLFRPLYLLRYIFPLSVVVWLIIGVVISRLKGRVVYLAVLLIHLLVVFVPGYQSDYQAQQEANARIEQTLAMTVDEIDGSDVILTDISHMAWTIASYYYPDVPNRQISLSEPPVLQQDKTYWVITLSNQPSENLSAFSDQGFTCHRVVADGCLGAFDVDIYCLSHE